jgi:hypothetical protein
VAWKGLVGRGHGVFEDPGLSQHCIEELRKTTKKHVRVGAFWAKI